MKKGKEDKEEIWSTNIGLLRKIPKSKTKYIFSYKDILLPILALVVFIIPFTFWINLIWGIIIGILLTAIFEISLFKKQNGILEVLETKEKLPLYTADFWETINHWFSYLIIIFFIISIIITLTWLGII